MPDLTGYAPSQRTLVDQYSALVNPNYTDYSGYGSLQNMGYGNATGGYSPDTAAAVAARNNSGVSTQDIYDGNGQLQSHNERATPKPNNNANAPAFQSAFGDDPFYSRSDVAPAIAATNQDVNGNGQYGLRGWAGDHPGGVIAAMIAAAAGGAALSGGFSGGAVGGGEVGGATGGGAGGGAAGGGGSLGGWGGGTNSGLGVFGGQGGGLAGVGGGNAGVLAQAGGISGGAGTGLFGSLGGSGLLSSKSLGNIQQLSGLLGGGKSQPQQQMSMPYIPQGMLGNQIQQQAKPTFVGLPTQQQMPYIPSRGYNAHDFYGAKVWT